VPKLVEVDVDLLSNLLSGVFPGSYIQQMENQALREQIILVCKARSLEPKEEFVQKVLQLFEI